VKEEFAKKELRVFGGSLKLRSTKSMVKISTRNYRELLQLSEPASIIKTGFNNQDLLYSSEPASIIKTWFNDQDLGQSSKRGK